MKVGIKRLKDAVDKESYPLEAVVGATIALSLVEISATLKEILIELKEEATDERSD